MLGALADPSARAGQRCAVAGSGVVPGAARRADGQPGDPGGRGAAEVSSGPSPAESASGGACAAHLGTSCLLTPSVPSVLQEEPALTVPTLLPPPPLMLFVGVVVCGVAGPRVGDHAPAFLLHAAASARSPSSVSVASGVSGWNG